MSFVNDPIFPLIILIVSYLGLVIAFTIYYRRLPKDRQKRLKELMVRSSRALMPKNFREFFDIVIEASSGKKVKSNVKVSPEINRKVTELSEKIDEISDDLENKSFLLTTNTGVTIDKKSIASIKTSDWFAKALFSFSLAFTVTLVGLYFSSNIGVNGVIFALIPTLALMVFSLITIIMLKDLVHIS